jgi:hypothetical protein
LKVNSSPSWVSRPSRKLPNDGNNSNTVEQSTWLDFIRLGKLVQGESEVLVCTRRENQSRLLMFKWVGEDMDKVVEQSLAFNNPNVVVARYVVSSDMGTHVAYDYVRFTLSEALSVHMAMEEVHVRAIAISVRQHGLILRRNSHSPGVPRHQIFERARLPAQSGEHEHHTHMWSNGQSLSRYVQYMP